MYGRRMSADFSTSTTLRICGDVSSAIQSYKKRSTYVDRPEASTVAGGHVLVEGMDGIAAGHLAVLLVHVVGTGARVVTDPDTEVLDGLGVLLVDLRGVIRLSSRSGALAPGESHAPRSERRSRRWSS
jgi:hypothetical protein